MCAVLTISRLVMKTKEPSLIGFDIKSLSMAEKYLTSDEEKIKLFEMFNSVYKIVQFHLFIYNINLFYYLLK